MRGGGCLISDKEAIKRRLESRKVIHSNGCWTFGMALLDKHSKTTINSKQYGIHVLSGYVYLGFHLDSPLMTLHKCGNGGCWNPEHLKQGLHKENMQDCINDGKCFETNKTHCSKGHEYSKENTLYPSRGGRVCRECNKQDCTNRYKKFKDGLDRRAK